VQISRYRFSLLGGMHFAFDPIRITLLVGSFFLLSPPALYWEPLGFFI
jgi:hypothetical protein